jgi:hypothetical protein
LPWRRAGAAGAGARSGDRGVVELTPSSYAIPGTSFHRELRRAGFSTRGWPVEVIQLDPTLPREALRDPSGWWLVAGDFDVI